jgi:hypothetical protein
MIQYTRQSARCVCEVHRDTHPEHAKHLVAHRGDFRCNHWDWVTDPDYVSSVERRRTRIDQRRRSSRPRVITGMIG